MKIFYLITLFLLVSQLGVAQTTYSHDTSGNRIKRLNAPPLPVTLISFLAAKQEATALLTWQTSSETNSDRFEIEKSQQGKNWINIGSIKANGDKDSNAKYSFLDNSLFSGDNLYRLKMIDRDETFAYSRIQRLFFNSTIIFYPNPVNDYLIIKGGSSMRINIVDNAGRLLYDSEVASTESIDMSSFSTGIYMVKLFNSDGSVTTTKVIKQ